MLAEYYDEEMSLIDTSDITTTNLVIPSVPFRNRWGGGQDKIAPIFLGVDYEQKIIRASIELISEDYYDYNLLRDKLYAIFGFNKHLYVVDKRQKGKRHGVVLEQDFSPTRHTLINGSVTIPFVTVKLPFAESIGTTQDIQTNGIDSEGELWGVGMGLIDDPDSHIYTHEGASFKIYNAGNVPIHPFEQELKITITNVQGSTEFLQLENITNGTVFKINEAVSDSQTIVLDGPNITSNGLAFLRSTNKKFIEIEPGWNDFEITGATSARVEFDFRFYYE